LTFDGWPVGLILVANVASVGFACRGSRCRECPPCTRSSPELDVATAAPSEGSQHRREIHVTRGDLAAGSVCRRRRASPPKSDSQAAFRIARIKGAATIRSDASKFFLSAAIRGLHGILAMNSESMPCRDGKRDHRDRRHEQGGVRARLYSASPW
jgi:hypothetical protein